MTSRVNKEQRLTYSFGQHVKLNQTSQHLHGGRHTPSDTTWYPVVFVGTNAALGQMVMNGLTVESRMACTKYCLHYKGHDMFNICILVLICGNSCVLEMQLKMYYKLLTDKGARNFGGSVFLVPPSSPLQLRAPGGRQDGLCLVHSQIICSSTAPTSLNTRCEEKPCTNPLEERTQRRTQPHKEGSTKTTRKETEALLTRPDFEVLIIGYGAIAPFTSLYQRHAK
eukprot:2430772-Amphidinium_carterae.1